MSRVAALLEERGVPYRRVEHAEPVFTVEVLLRYAGVPAAQIVKVLILGDGAGARVAVLLPGSRKLDLAAARQATGLRLALLRPAEIEDAIGFPVGAISPVGLDGRVNRVLADPALFAHARLNISSGEPDWSIEVAAADLWTVVAAERAPVSRDDPDERGARNEAIGSREKPMSSPNDESQLFAEVRQAILDGDDERAAALAQQALDQGLSPLEAIDSAFVPAIRTAGELWEAGEIFLPELVTAAQAMTAAMEVLRPRLKAAGLSSGLGKVVIGTVKGDVHDIGKTLVATLLQANGFEVFDEGADVSVDRFVSRAHELDADLVCASAMLTTTMIGQRNLVAALVAAGSKARVMVGGAPVTAEWATEIGAFYADNAVTAVVRAKELVAP